MKLVKRITSTAVAVAATTGLLFGGFSYQAKAASSNVVVAGSTALLPLTQQAKVEYQKTNKDVSISVSGSSSIDGPESVMKGTATIGACDWDATVAQGGFKAYKELRAYKVAVTPFATIVNKSNKVKNLSTKQLQGIFSGKIKNWKEVGGKDAKIVVVNRKFGSGTRVNFQAKALKGSKFMTSGNYKEVGKSGEMIASIQSNPNAIGYVDLAYVDKSVKALQYNNVSPTVENVKNGKYPVWGYGYLLTKGAAKGDNLKFIQYMQSNKFQNGSLKKLDFVPFKNVK
ncbi:phosphate ABC transporter substrate-binding protein [Bacillus sp. FJAT-49736]|uniref:phosphate ABC transporter substrate-binding protein n=1 Tax=Bacillus sp. FJAT-49736 TaxID=2833582 RepID=UPI001BC9AF5C|nr:phosphate ABC transporter substrate-binding protein [Bacillus sp. FJAT-49736]MBS4174351.1 phosphate ABC transporter substrate-binding protein [Bacillus sp. FJAT-49736]